MKTKKFNAVFGGETYELDILSKKRVCEILDYEINQEKVLEALLNKHVNGNRTEALFNVSSGEVEYHHFTGNSDLQRRSHLITLFALSGNTTEGLEVGDFLDDEEIEKAGEDVWNFIAELDDYNDRLLNAYLYVWRGFDEDKIRLQISDIYD